jgi:hypothetical protein
MPMIFPPMVVFIFKKFLFCVTTVVNYLCLFGINYFNTVHSVQLYASFVQLVGSLITRNISLTWLKTLGRGGGGKNRPRVLGTLIYEEVETEREKRWV